MRFSILSPSVSQMNNENYEAASGVESKLHNSLHGFAFHIISIKTSTLLFALLTHTALPIMWRELQWLIGPIKRLLGSKATRATRTTEGLTKRLHLARENPRSPYRPELKTPRRLLNTPTVLHFQKANKPAKRRRKAKKPAPAITRPLRPRNSTPLLLADNDEIVVRRPLDSPSDLKNKVRLPRNHGDSPYRKPPPLPAPRLLLKTPTVEHFQKLRVRKARRRSRRAAVKG